jgi:ribosomal protein S18 acetylase RimI-like enzyme
VIFIILVITRFNIKNKLKIIIIMTDTLTRSTPVALLRNDSETVINQKDGEESCDDMNDEEHYHENDHSKDEIYKKEENEKKEYKIEEYKKENNEKEVNEKKDKNPIKDGMINKKKQNIINIDNNRINERLFKRSAWDSLPMKRNNQHQNHIIRPDYDIGEEDVPLVLPEGYQWKEYDSEDEKEMEIISIFLNSHFHKNRHSNGNMETFQQVYDGTFLNWLFSSPTWNRFYELNSDPHKCCIGVSTKQSDKLVGLMTFRPIIYRLDNQVIQSFYIDFFCVHKKLRNKRLGWVMMKECFRRIQKFNINSGIAFHTDIHMPFNNISQTSHLLIKNLAKDKCDPTKDLNLIRFATQDDIPDMIEIYNSYEPSYRAIQNMNQHEFEHYFLPQNEFVHTYVLTNSLGEIKDFVSLYSKTTKSGHKVAFLNFISYINDVLLNIFMKNLFYIMKANGFQYITLYDNMGLDGLLNNKLGFQRSDNISNFYVFNYNTFTIPNKECAMNVIR